VQPAGVDGELEGGAERDGAAGVDSGGEERALVVDEQRLSAFDRLLGCAATSWEPSCAWGSARDDAE
jgi:hypothetical protein